ncbi:FkbM family methyltransferase [Polynucleobacter sp. AM-25C3]|uniref:FkbM family methyltransferase n=1 Tax=Polynucleobacter sp. AM-25C3 TaxID=1855569 RepID=UPI001C0E0DA0|nr:FkbM family methyltransferase [Polynucleobacter sp. AM-25C3]MBU3601764.1 FkbM family methyltransferase [Polynucleobacter sp. AM-25C3]
MQKQTILSQVMDRCFKPFKKLERFLDEKIFNLTLLNRADLHTLPEKIYLSRLLPFLNVDCVFDVGANNGQYAQMLRKHVGYQGRIISFEPIPSAADKIRKLALHDPLWTVEQIALDEVGGVGEFNIMQGDQFSSLGTPSHEANANFQDANKSINIIQVQKETLEEAYSRLKAQYQFVRPFLKMDTQGFDVRVARGGKNIISNFLGLQSELAVQKLYQESIDFREAISFYESLGFTLGSLVPNNGGGFPDMVEIDCIMVNDAMLEKSS